MARTPQRANKSELARVLGVVPSTITRAVEHHTFPEADKAGTFEIKAAIVWWYLNREGGATASTGSNGNQDSDDPLMSGEGSPALERYRLAKAQQEEIKLAELCGRIVTMDSFEPAVSIMIEPIRKVIETLKRKGHVEAFELISEAVEEAVDSLLGYADDCSSTTSSTMDRASKRRERSAC